MSSTDVHGSSRETRVPWAAVDPDDGLPRRVMDG